MKKNQWIVLGATALFAIGLYFVTQPRIFGNHPKDGNTGSTVHAPGDGHDHDEALGTDSILAGARRTLRPEQASRVALLENSISRGDVSGQKIHLYHQLAAFWRDSAQVFEPFAWYSAEAARLENSEKSLTFAAQLFLSSLREEGNAGLLQWKAAQAKDLFERSLQINPSSDSSQVGLGATLLFGSIGMPMEAVGKINAVAARDSNFVYAQQILGEASLLSGQTDKAIARFERVVRLQPGELRPVLLLADVCEKAGRKAEAASWYRRSLTLIGQPELKKEVERRIAELNK